MAYWQFDLTFVNLEALPEGTMGLLVRTLSSTGSDALHLGMLSGSESLTVSVSTAEPGGFELIASDQVWFVVMLATSTNTIPSLYSIGPYTVGDIGTEVPAP